MTQKLSPDVQKDTEAKLQALVDLAFHEGLAKAIKEARASGDAYLLDLFHDTLVDRFYDELIARHKLEKQ